MNVVLDVSAVIQIIFQAPKFYKFNDTLRQADTVFAPELYVAELTNTLWKYYQFNKCAAEQCEQFISDGLEFVDEFVSSQKLWRTAFALGVKSGHAVYDMYYAALARLNNGALLTNDRELAKICQKLKIEYFY